MLIQSYGAGVQSRAILYMVREGLLPKPDAIYFGDTGSEPEEIYRAVEIDRVVAASLGIDFRVVSFGNGLADPPYGVHTPLFTIRKADGKKGQLFRTCTDRFKIRPIRQDLKKRGVKKGVRVWIGFSTDEIDRVKPSTLKWYTQSSCVFCPFHDKSQWEYLLRNPNDLAKAIAYDESIRHKRPGFLCFVHSARKPLREALHLETENDGLGCGNVCFT